jgi:nitroimidazol reductase NimA-like FMN-containing flavoprotein (pyridoxamine 5'-phosphate oxidase superfamily)
MSPDSGMYGELAMTPEELNAFLASTETIMLASLRKDGSPFVVPVGFDWDGEYFYVTLGRDHAGAHRLRRDRRVSLAAGSHPSFPTKFVIVEGFAEELPDPDNVISKRILFRASQQVFADARIDPERFFDSWVSVGRVVFRIRVGRLVTFDGTKTPRGSKYTAGARLPTDPAIS